MLPFEALKLDQLKAALQALIQELYSLSNPRIFSKCVTSTFFIFGLSV